MGNNGRIYPAEQVKEKQSGYDLFGEIRSVVPGAGEAEGQSG